MKSNTLELARSQLLPTEGGLTASEVEQMLRLEWWLNHGHSGLYGDDGEMQCSTCPADFKRQPLEELESLVCVARMTAAAPARPTSRVANLLAVSPHERGGPMPNLPSGYHRDTPTIIQRARGLLADGVDFMAIGNFAATYAVLAPLAKQDIGAIFGYLMKSVDSKARREALAEQRRSRHTAPLLAVGARGG
jgi:hypothetical protein